MAPRPKKTIGLGDVQRKRHRVFEKILNLWNQRDAQDWLGFLRGGSTLEDGKPLAPEDSLLARNLVYFFRSLGRVPLPVRHVLLYFHRHEGEFPEFQQADEGPTFKLVCVQYRPLEDAGYFEITP